MRNILPFLCLTVSTTTLSFQLFVVYPNQNKMQKDIREIKKYTCKKE